MIDGTPQTCLPCTYVIERLFQPSSVTSCSFTPQCSLAHNIYVAVKAIGRKWTLFLSLLDNFFGVCDVTHVQSLNLPVSSNLIFSIKLICYRLEVYQLLIYNIKIMFVFYLWLSHTYIYILICKHDAHIGCAVWHAICVPWHVLALASNEYPLLQSQKYDPRVLLQIWWQSFTVLLHSSISKKQEQQQTYSKKD